MVLIGGIPCIWVVSTVLSVPVGPLVKVSVLESDPTGSTSLSLDGVVPVVCLGSIVALKKLRSVS